MIEIKHKYTGADLRCANLRGANLHDADLRCANLRCANLRDADLRDAHLRCADLRDADLRCADLRGANLDGANLRGADLRGANLDGANLRGANLDGANLRCADLHDANLDGADLHGADLHGAKGLDTFTVAAPEGALIGWKKCRDGVLVKLSIPADARRVNAIGSRKCRAEFADVLEVIGAARGQGIHNSGFFYVPGARVVPRSYDPDNRVECSGGIHFFITRGEAEAYS